MKVGSQESGVRRQESGGKKSRRYAVGSRRKNSFFNSTFRIPYSAFFLLLAVYCLLLTEVHAEEKTITLQDACRSAISTYESLMLSQEDLYQAEKGIDKAVSQLLPSITADGNYIKYSESETSGGFNTQPDNSSSFTLKLNQPLYSGGKEWSLWRQSKKKVESSRHGVEANKEGIILNVSKAYYGVLKAEKIVEIKEAALKRAMEQRRVASTRFQVGDVTKAIVLRAESEVANAEAEVATAKKDLFIARDRLARLIGISEDFKVTSPDIQNIPEATIDKLISLSLEKRRDYIQSRIDEEVAEEGILYARGNFLPSIRLEGVYSKKDQDPKSTLFNEESIYGGIIFTYPIFEGGLRKAELAEANSKKRQTELKRVSLKRDIELGVKEAFRNLEVFNSIIKSYERQLSFAEENYNMVFKQFTYGLSTSVDVIDANSTLISSQSSLVNSRYDLQIAIVELQKNAGILLENILGADIK